MKTKEKMLAQKQKSSAAFFFFWQKKSMWAVIIIPPGSVCWWINHEVHFQKNRLSSYKTMQKVLWGVIFHFLWNAHVEQTQLVLPNLSALTCVNHFHLHGSSNIPFYWKPIIDALTSRTKTFICVIDNEKFSLSFTFSICAFSQFRQAYDYCCRLSKVPPL